MKKLIVLIAILALVALPAIASESTGPPGEVLARSAPTIDSATIFAGIKVLKEIPTIDVDAIAASTLTLVVVALAVWSGIYIFIPKIHKDATVTEGPCVLA